MAKRRSLGRGLDALLSNGEGRAHEARPEGEARAHTDVLRDLPLDLLQRGRYQPRIDMREETLTELAESIRVQGIVQPVVVRPIAAEGSGEQHYELIAGERRWRAAQMAGLDSIPALVRDIPDEAAVAVALIENIQRENLNPLEESRSLKRLIDEFGMTHSEAADAVGRSRVAVSNLLRLLELPETVRKLLKQRELNMGHARALLGVTSPDALADLAQRVVREGWSVRETEKAVRKLAESDGKSRPARSAKGQKDPNVARLESELSEKLGASVAIDHGAKGGRLVIRYHTLDELEGIVEHIK